MKAEFQFFSDTECLVSVISETLGIPWRVQSPDSACCLKKDKAAVSCTDALRFTLLCPALRLWTLFCADIRAVFTQPKTLDMTRQS